MVAYGFMYEKVYENTFLNRRRVSYIVGVHGEKAELLLKIKRGKESDIIVKDN